MKTQTPHYPKWYHNIKRWKNTADYLLVPCLFPVLVHISINWLCTIHHDQPTNCYSTCTLPQCLWSLAYISL